VIVLILLMLLLMLLLCLTIAGCKTGMGIDKENKEDGMVGTGEIENVDENVDENVAENVAGFNLINDEMFDSRLKKSGVNKVTGIIRDEDKVAEYMVMNTLRYMTYTDGKVTKYKVRLLDTKLGDIDSVKKDIAIEDSVVSMSIVLDSIYNVTEIDMLKLDELIEKSISKVTEFKFNIIVYFNDNVIGVYQNK